MRSSTTKCRGRPSPPLQERCYLRVDDFDAIVAQVDLAYVFQAGEGELREFRQWVVLKENVAYQGIEGWLASKKTCGGG